MQVYRIFEGQGHTRRSRSSFEGADGFTWQEIDAVLLLYPCCMYLARLHEVKKQKQTKRESITIQSDVSIPPFNG